MYKRALLLVIIGLFSISFMGNAQINRAFQEGEKLSFKVSFGWFNAADAQMVIDKDLHLASGQSSYKIDIYGETLGVFKLFKVNDHWGSILDSKQLIPHQSYRHIEEGGYRKHEVIDFDHDTHKAIVKIYDREGVELVEEKSYDVPPNVQDIVSGFYLLRTMDLNGHSKGDEILITGFFDKKTYHLRLIYEGKESVKTDLGIFEDAFVFSPIMPSNKLFRGERPIKLWVSNDANKIPLKVKAKLLVGAVNLDIVGAEGLRNDSLTLN